MKTIQGTFAYKLLSVLIIASFLFSLVQPTVTFAAPPPPEKEPLGVPDSMILPEGVSTPPAPDMSTIAVDEQQRAQEAVDRAVEKFLAYWGPRYKVQTAEVNVLEDWGYGVADWQSQEQVTNDSLNIIAHRMQDGSWQAILPDGSDTFKQWLKIISNNLIPQNLKNRIILQDEELQAKKKGIVKNNQIEQPGVTEEPFFIPRVLNGNAYQKPKLNVQPFFEKDLKPNSLPQIQNNLKVETPPLQSHENSLSTINSFDASTQVIKVNTTVALPIGVDYSLLTAFYSEDPENVAITGSGPITELLIVSFDQYDDIAIATVAINNSENEGHASPENTTSVAFQNISANMWDASFYGKQKFEIIVNSISNTKINESAKQYLLPNKVDNISAQGIPTSLKFPWKSPQSWKFTTGLHGTNNSALDFGAGGISPSSDRYIAASAPGVIIRYCTGEHQAWVMLRHSTGTSSDYWTGYLHLDKDTVNLSNGNSVNQGDILGRTYNIAGSEVCSPYSWKVESSGPHVHFSVGTVPASGSNITSVNIAGTVISGWTVEANGCLSKNGGSPICAGSNSYFQSDNGGGGSDTTKPTGGFDSPSENSTISSGSVYISGWGSDSGGSGFDRAHFTASWPGRDWHVISQDFTSSTFGFNWDMCGEGVPNGQQISLGLDIWDKAGNNALSPGGVRHFYKSYTCNSGSSGTWKADYFDTIDRWNDNNNSGNFRCSENIGGTFLDKNYGTGTACGMDPETWVGEYSTTINFPSGDYVFQMEHDDGMKIWLDGNHIDFSGSGESGSQNLCPARHLEGNHTLKAMLREDGGDARIRLSWTTDTSLCNRAPYKPTLSSPNDFAESTTQAPTLCWQNSGDPDGDTVQYYAEVFGSAVNANSGWTSSTCWRPSNLDGQYYNYQWHVRARDSRQNLSDWSDTWHFTIKQATSGIPNLVSPSNGVVVGRNDTVTLQWSTASNASQYYAEFWGGPSFNVNSGWTTGTSWTVGSTFWGGNYQWRVRSRTSSNAESGWSETRSLIRRYGAPGSLSSSNIGQNAVTLNWSASADAPGNIAGYRIYRDGSPTGTVGSSTTLFTDTGISCGEQHTYFVRAYNNDLESTNSNSITVNTQNCPPADTTPPTITWVRPVANQQNAYCLNESVQLEAQASDNVGVDHVLFHWYNAENSEWIDISYDYDAPYQSSMDCNSLNVGWNQLNASAEDLAGNSSTNYIWVYRYPPAPDLAPYTPHDREYPVVPSSVPGTTTVNDLYSNINTYLDWIFVNQGNGPANDSFDVEIWLDNNRLIDYNFPGLANGYLYSFEDWSIFVETPGWHSLRMIVDPDNVISESNEENNSWENDFFFTAHAPYENDFESQSDEWMMSGLWDLSDIQQYSGDWSWWFGNPTAGNYDLGHVTGDLTSPSIYIPSSGYFLRFNYRYETETRGPEFDQRWIQISVDDGEFVNIYQLFDDLMNTWLAGPVIDLSNYAGHTVKIRYHFDSLDGFDNAYQGWFIDDFEITSVAPPACPDAYEANNSVSEATNISYDDEVDGAICPNGDFDYYAFMGEVGDVIIADIDTQSTSTLDPVLSLIGTNGTTVLSQNDDDGYSLDSKIGYVIENTGVHYLKVRNYHHPSNGDSSSTYSLKLYLDNADPTFAEFNNPINRQWIDPTQIELEVSAEDIESGISRVEFLWHSADWENDEWEWLGYDSFGYNGFHLNVDTSILAEQQGAAFYAWAYDYSGKYTSAGVWDLGIDRTAPSTSANISQMYGGANFIDFYVEWAGTDNLSGIAQFDVQVRDGSGGSWTDLVTTTTSSWYYYVGQQGHTYQFRTRATDFADNTSEFPASHQASYNVNVCSITADNGEANNNPATAKPYPVNTPTSLNFHMAGDEDWYYFDTNTGHQFEIQTANTGGYADTVLSLYEADGTTLVESNDDTDGLNLASRIVWTADHDGHYYVKVSHWLENAYGCQTTYDLVVDDITPKPLPEINTISPEYINAGSDEFYIQILGSKFVASSLVRWDGNNLETIYIANGELMAVVPGNLVASAGLHSVTVFTPQPGGGVSSARTFTINNPLPTLSYISPSSVEVGSSSFIITLNGSGFVNTSKVLWNGSELATNYVSSSQLTAAVPSNLLTTSGTANIIVRSPIPGGGDSAALTFVVNNPVPILSNISPSSVTAGGASFTLTANGSKFVSGAVIQWNGVDLPTTYVSNTKLTAQVAAEHTVTGSIVGVRVVNPPFGGGNSVERTITINNPVPSLSNINPNALPSGGPDFTLSVTGSNFVPTSKILWNGTEMNTTFVSSTQLAAFIPSANLFAKGSANVSVRNSIPGGGTSGIKIFTIQASGVCSPYRALSCGSSDTTSNNASGSTNRVDSYACSSSWSNETGPEMAYSFQPNADYNASVALSGMTADLDIFVLDNPAGECKGDNCIAAHENTASFLAQAGQTYYLIVDGYNGAVGNYTITVNCSVNQIPTITSLSPMSVVVGASSFTLSVTGTNFVKDSVVRWNGSALTTSYVSSTQLNATVPAGNLTETDMINITVSSPPPGGGESDPVEFSVLNPTPSLSTVTPNQLSAEGESLILTATGTKFITGATVLWNDTPLPTTYISTTSLTAEVDATRLSTSGIVVVKVMNPTPGGGKSSGVNVEIRNPLPILNSINPPSIKAGRGDFNLTLSGSDFVSSAVVRWNGTALTTNRDNANQLTAVVPASLIANPGVASITVFQPTPGGGTSSALQYPIQPANGVDCQSAISIEAAFVDRRRNDGPGSTDVLNNYGIVSRSEDGPEFVYKFTPQQTGAVNVFLSGISVNLDLFLLDGSFGACSSGEVIAYGDKEIRFEAEQGHMYYVVVDGYRGAKGLYTLSIDDNNRSPANGIQLLNNRQLFNWEETPGATKYILQFSTTDSFRTVTISRTVTKSIYLFTSDLPKDKNLYWRIIPMFGSRKGTYSDTWALMTAYPPSTPSLVSPSSGSLQHTLNPRLDWSTAKISYYKTFSHYQVEVAKDSSFLVIVASEEVGNLTASEIYLATVLEPNTKYYWRVRAFTTDGHYSNWSSVRYFRTSLSIPTLIEPANQFLDSGLRPTFSWQPVSGVTGYTLQVSLSPTFSSLTIGKNLSTTTYNPSTNLRSGRIYYWRVRSNGANGPSKWSEVWSFTTQ